MLHLPSSSQRRLGPKPIYAAQTKAGLDCLALGKLWDAFDACVLRWGDRGVWIVWTKDNAAIIATYPLREREYGATFRVVRRNTLLP